MGHILHTHTHAAKLVVRIYNISAIARWLLMEGDNVKTISGVAINNCRHGLRSVGFTGTT